MKYYKVFEDLLQIKMRPSVTFPRGQPSKLNNAWNTWITEMFIMNCDKDFNSTFPCLVKKFSILALTVTLSLESRRPNRTTFTFVAKYFSKE